MQLPLEHILSHVLPQDRDFAEFHYYLEQKYRPEPKGQDFADFHANEIRMYMAKYEGFIEGQQAGYREGYMVGYHKGLKEEDEPAIGDKVVRITQYHLKKWGGSNG